MSRHREYLFLLHITIKIWRSGILVAALKEDVFVHPKCLITKVGMVQIEHPAVYVVLYTNTRKLKSEEHWKDIWLFKVNEDDQLCSFVMVNNFTFYSYGICSTIFLIYKRTIIRPMLASLLATTYFLFSAEPEPASQNQGRERETGWSGGAGQVHNPQDNPVSSSSITFMVSAIV